VSHDYARRLARARDATERAGLDALVVTPSADLVYLVGYDAPQLERLTALVLRVGGDPLLLVPELERPRAAASPAGRLVGIDSWPDSEVPYEALRRALGGAGRYGATDRMWGRHLLELQRALPQAEFLPASPVLSTLRTRKEPEEIELLARAGSSADETFGRISGEGLTGRTEEEISRSLAAHLVDTGHQSAGFGIVASGPNGASPHHQPSDRTIRHGDTVVLDFGGRVGGYYSDISRTVSVGEPSPEVSEVHEIVRDAQEAAFRSVRPGVPAEDVDETARQVIEGAGYGHAILHRTGHGIGLEEHEDPYIVKGNDQPLQTGMCFSIEPGIYLQGRFGVRIEDIVVVTEDGARRLNDAPRELAVVA